jgi:exopolyphosphatase/guanosine-5'-triphosphate,3'-diphosphate pyrophosphatase
MRIAIIDIGTNTFNLLIQEIEKNTTTLLHKDKISVKLGEGGINDGVIHPIPFQRGLDAIGVHLATINQFDVDKIVAFATSAVRSAKNGVEFKAAILEQYHLLIDIIEGDREADLIYKGVKEACDLAADTILIMDVGGGSTEFILANKDEIFWKRSYNIGAARLLDRFKHSEPITASEIATIQDYLDLQFSDLKDALKKWPTATLIGSSGSFETLADILAHKHLNRSIFDTPFTSIPMDVNQLKALFPEILSKNIAQRMEIKGMLELRVDMMVVVTIFIEYIIEEFAIEKVILSDYAMKEGILTEVIQKDI